MLVKDLKGILTSKAKLMYERFGEYEYELNEVFSIAELIERGYGESKIKKIFTYKCVLNIVIE